jgi:hypothetical protein
MRSFLNTIPALCVLLLAGCAKQPAAPAADAPRATVVMRDGRRLTGLVTASTPSEITLNVDGGAPQTISMRDVRRVDYAEPAASLPPATAPGASPAPAPVPLPEPTHEDHRHAEPAEIRSTTLVVPAGAELPVRTEETIDSAVAREGQTYAAEIAADVRDRDGAVVLPRGANAKIVIRSASGGGKFHGAADLVMDLDSVSVGGRQYRLDTVDLAEKGHDNVGINKRTGKIVGGGAAIGAIIGAIAGGGHGAAMGAGAGAGAGAVGEVLTKGGSIKVPAETVLRFRLERALRVVAE